MTAQPRFTQREIARALRAAKSCGYEEVRVSIGRDGKIDIIVGEPANDHPQGVDLK